MTPGTLVTIESKRTIVVRYGYFLKLGRFLKDCVFVDLNDDATFCGIYLSDTINDNEFARVLLNDKVVIVRKIWLNKK